MSIVVVKIKLMPTSPETDMKRLEKNIESLLEKNNVKNPKFTIEPIAFGLKALIVMFGWPESQELETLEESLRNVDSVSSIEILDMRRAIG